MRAKRRFRPSRLGRKFLGSFLVAGLPPLLLMGGASVYLVNSIHRTDIATAEQSVANEQAAEITAAMNKIVELFEVKVLFEAFAPIESGDQKTLLEKTLAEYPALRNVSFICLTPIHCTIGYETTRMSRGGATSTPRNMSGSDEFRAARGGKNYVGPVELTPGAIPTLIIATPVVNKKGEVIAVLRGELELTAIQNIVAAAKLGETGYLYVASREGGIVAHPDRSKIGTPPPSAPAIEALLEGNIRTGLEPDAVYKNVQGEDVRGAGTFLPELGWAVVAEWPEAETQAVVNRVLRVMFQFAGGALLLIVALAVFTTRNLLKPIKQIKEGVGTIGQGNLDYRFELKTGDELEELGTHLNEMAVNLKAVEELRVLKLRTQVLAENLRKERDLSQLKDQFVNTVSHQFNTPLTVISWTLAAMKDPNVSPQSIHENLLKIAQSRKDMLAIVNDLLTLSEIGFHYRKSNTARIDMKTLTEQVAGGFKEAAGAKNISIVVRAAEGDSTADANAFAVTKVIENLIDNAVTYANDGSAINIEIGGNAKELQFTVSNEGIGIPAEDKGRIFQQFFRAKNSVAKKNVGTGLGLFIVKTIVEGHDGRVWFESEEGKGASFSFAIPR